MKKLLAFILLFIIPHTIQSGMPLFPAYARIDSRWYVIDNTSNIVIVGTNITALNIQAAGCLRSNGDLPELNTNFHVILGPNKENVGFFSFRILLRESGTGYFVIATTPNVDLMCLGEVPPPFDAPSTDVIFLDSFEHEISQ